MTELKLEVGKTYLSRGGNKFNITEYCFSKFPFKEEGGLWFRENGNYSIVESVHDLISEFIETPEHKLEIGKKYICDDWAEQAEFVFIKNQIYYFFDEKYGFSWFGFEYLLKNNIREYKETKIVEGTVAVCYHNGIGWLTTEHSVGNQATIKLTYNCDTQEVKAEVVK